MIRTKFYLEKRRGKDGVMPSKNIPIIMSSSFNGYRLMHYTGERTDENKWDNKNQRVKSSVTGALEINSILNKLSEDVSRIYREARLNEVTSVTPQYIKNKLNKIEAKSKTVLEAYQEFIDSKKHQFATNTIKKYNTSLNILKEFVSKTKFDLTFDTINDSFRTKYERFLLIDKNHNNNTLSKDMKLLKAFLTWAYDRDYNKNLAFKKFSYKEKVEEIVALNWDELIKIYEAELPTKCFEQVRDAFCFGCFTGLRYSDIANLKRGNVMENAIALTTIKTKEFLTIPLNKYSKQILNKYKDYPTLNCLPVISNQKSNNYLKEIGKLLNLKRLITKVRYKGNQRIEKTHFLYELLTTHVARKTFVTNSYRKQMPTEVIMNITGHKSASTLARYNNISEQQKTELMNSIFN